MRNQLDDKGAADERVNAKGLGWKGNEEEFEAYCTGFCSFRSGPKNSSMSAIHRGGRFTS